ncbi:MAG: PDZ domain-containing protein [Pseudoxanthomonas sp.]
MFTQASVAGLLMVAGLFQPTQAAAATTTYPILAMQSSMAGNPARYELGAVVDVRNASSKGIKVMAVTPEAAADRIGLRVGDQLLAINGHRLDDTLKPASTLENALQEGSGALRLEIMRDGRPLLLSGRADARVAGSGQACGYVTSQQGVVPQSEDIFDVEITQIEGRSTPLQTSNRHRVEAGKRVLVVREMVPDNYLNSAELQQIRKMKRFAFARAYKSFVVDVQPGMSYRIGARLIREKLDTQSIRDNAYWEPVVWSEVPQSCP